MNRISPAFVHSLGLDEIFVFGSNLAGRHGAGAAKQAVKWGAKYGQGVGYMGRTYAIPTKDEKIKSLPLIQIASHVELFIEFAKEVRYKRFLVTKIGCGRAGYDAKVIAPFFYKAIDVSNIFLPSEFWQIINKIS